MPIGWHPLFGEESCCQDQTGGLKILARLLDPLKVRWLVLADGAGKPLAAWSAELPFTASDAERLASEAARRLEGQSWCTFQRQGGSWLAFALRIARQTGDVLLAGALRREPGACRRLRARRHSLEVGGRLASGLVEMYARNQRLRAQVRQLVAECETVRAAQAEAVAAALAACERRLREGLAAEDGARASNGSRTLPLACSQQGG